MNSKLDSRHSRCRLNMFVSATSREGGDEKKWSNSWGAKGARHHISYEGWTCMTPGWEMGTPDCVKREITVLFRLDVTILRLQILFHMLLNDWRLVMQVVVTCRLVWQAKSEQRNKADFDSINGYLSSHNLTGLAHTNTSRIN